ncbi:MAG TPA: hypothetical protein VMF61_03620 [Candidatus Acidoferrales bacterium]|nr:hypothetical protein [Candidatus Acidoferrales bacterium]
MTLRTAFLSLAIAAGIVLLRSAAARAAEPVTLDLDATKASHGIIYAHERIPVEPGTFTMVYPKWIPGEHGPTGPLNDLAALRVSANGRPLDWRRDRIDLYAFHVQVPQGVRSIDVDFDVLLNAPGDVMSTVDMAILNWNRALLYRDGVDSHDYFFKPSIELPAGWQYATALRGAAESGNRVDFAVTPLNMLVDSPLDMGRFVKKWDLWRQGDAFVQFDVFAGAPQDLDISSELLDAYKRLPAEAFAMYGSRHFDDYHALLTLSDSIGFQGIEHHQSSDDRAGDDFLTNPKQSLAGGDLVPHEFSHSWNGKYRRPADLTTPNFQVPQQTDLLWVYEGMNQYLGDVLSFRCGIRKPSTFAEYMATVYAQMDTESGRTTTPLIDLTTGAPYYYEARGQYGSIRRNANDFYSEGELVWLDVDTIIRQLSHGTRSLDTFLHRYSEPALTGPITVTYTREQIERLLGEVQPYDWHDFFERYVYSVSLHPPADEFARAGWKLVYNDKPNEYVSANDDVDDSITGWYSYGADLSAGGVVGDVRVDSPAWKAGLVPGMRVIAVGGQAFSTSNGKSDSVGSPLDYAVSQARHSSAPIGLVVAQDGWLQTLSLDYHDGMLYPHLVRVEGSADMLASIAAPHAK